MNAPESDEQIAARIQMEEDENDPEYRQLA